MATLSDADILAAMKAEALAVEPFQEANLTPNGYDLSIAEVVLPDTSRDAVAPDAEGNVTIPPLTRFAVATREVVRLGPGICGSLWIRSTWARRGVLAAFGKVEAGFDGTLTIGAFNAASQPLTLPVGDRFCQIVFEEMLRAPEKLYADRSGTYQHQRGVNLGD